MRRPTIAALLVLALSAVACGAEAAPDSTVADSGTTAQAATPETTSAPTTSDAPADTTQATSSAPSEAAPPSGVEGPPAPDFTFALDDGSTFVLSEEAMPVYMVFWAEW